MERRLCCQQQTWRWVEKGFVSIQMSEKGEMMTAPSARPKPATISDVATQAGVSVGTVSKVLNGRPGISQATRANVEDVAQRLSFRANPLARGLLAGKTGTVGLLSDDLQGRFSLPILMGVEDALGAGQLSVFLCDARGDAIREQFHLNALLNRRVDGLIVVADRADPRPSLGRRIPVPVVYAYGPSVDPEDASVVPDDVDAGRIGVSHLLSMGRGRIGYAGGDAQYAAALARAEGAGAALADAGLDFAVAPVFGQWTEAWGRQAARVLLDADPAIDAIMCGNDQIARGVMDCLREMGKDIPNDIAVLGHDNWEVFAAQARPPLSTIDMNFQEVGRTAAQLLFSALEGEHRPGLHIVRGRVVVRESTF